MTAARARRRLMRHERYRHRALLLAADTCMASWGYSVAHSGAAWLAVHTGRYYPIGIRRDPWILPSPRCQASILSPGGPMRCFGHATTPGHRYCAPCRRRLARAER